MAPQKIKDLVTEHGPFNFKPLPKSDNIVRSVKRENYSDGGGYEGEVDAEDRPDGRGIKLVPAEYFYEGYFMAGLRNGRGRVILKNGIMYEGEFKDDKKHGFGEILWPSTNKYIGFYYLDNRHAYGNYIFSNGSRYEGEFNNGNGISRPNR